MDTGLVGTFRNPERAAGFSPQRKEPSVPYSDGKKNDKFANPTFRSTVFESPSGKKASIERVRSSNKEDFGPDIYRKVLYVDRPRETAERTRSRNLKSSVHLDGPVESKAYKQNHANFYEGDIHNRSSHRSSYKEKLQNMSGHQNRKLYSPLRQPSAEDHQHSRSDHKHKQNVFYTEEERPETGFVRPPLPPGSSSAVQHGQQTHEIQYDGLNHCNMAEADRRCLSGHLHEFNIRSAERILHDTYYNRGTDPAHVESAETPNIFVLPAVQSSNPRPFRVSVDQRSQDQDSHYEGHETSSHLLKMKDKLSADPDEEQVEALFKREYRKKLDEYHRQVADAKLQQKLPSGSAKKKQAPHIRAESEVNEAEVRLAQQVKKEDQEKYKQFLDQQRFDKELFKQEQKALEEGIDRITGKSLGINRSGQKKRTAGAAIDRLGKELQETINYRKKLDQLTRSGNAEEILKHTWTLERSNLKQPQSDQKRAEVAQATEHKQLALERKLATTQQDAHEKELEKFLVQAAHSHDQRQMEYERPTKSQQRNELRESLVKQVQEKNGWPESEASAHKTTTNRYDKKLVVNWDQRSELKAKEQTKQAEIHREKQADREMVQALNDFDNIKMQAEADRNRVMSKQLRVILTEQIRLNEEK